MTSIFKVNNVVKFGYCGKVRRVRIESVKMGYRYGGLTYSITGWDYEADYPAGGFRTFLVAKIKNPVLCHPITSR